MMHVIMLQVADSTTEQVTLFRLNRQHFSDGILHWTLQCKTGDFRHGCNQIFSSWVQRSTACACCSRTMCCDMRTLRAYLSIPEFCQGTMHFQGPCIAANQRRQQPQVAFCLVPHSIRLLTSAMVHCLSVGPSTTRWVNSRSMTTPLSDREPD